MSALIVKFYLIWVKLVIKDPVRVQNLTSYVAWGICMLTLVVDHLCWLLHMSKNRALQKHDFFKILQFEIMQMLRNAVLSYAMLQHGVCSSDATCVLAMVWSNEIVNKSMSDVLYQVLQARTSWSDILRSEKENAVASAHHNSFIIVSQVKCKVSKSFLSWCFQW